MHKPHLLKSDHLYDYLLSISLREKPLQTSLREQTIAQVAESEMMTSPEQVQMLALFMKLIAAKNVIEVGVYTGYGTLGMALALPKDGKIIACDLDKNWPAVGEPYWEQAGVRDKIDLKIGLALNTLQNLLKSGQKEKFDFIFIDADKINYPNYYELALQLIRPGGLIVLDNMLMIGDIIVMEQKTESAKILHQLSEKLLQDNRIDLSLVTMGEGMTVIRKK